MPVLVGIGMVKNEQDVIEAFVRHNLRLLDALVLMDNGSVDATRDILAGLVHELAGLVVVDIPQFGDDQAARMTRLLHAAQDAFFADFLMPLDADEFIRAPDRAALRAELARIPEGGVGLLPWQTFVPTPEDHGTDPPCSLRRRRIAEQPLYAKAVLRLDGRTARGLALERGSHGVLRDGVAIPPALILDLPLIHVPVRSLSQLVAKSVVGWTARLAMEPAARGSADGYQLRTVFDAVATGAPPPDVTAMALDYAQAAADGDWQTRTVADDPGWLYQRRLSDGRPFEPLALIARSWEQALAKPAAALALQRPAALPSGAPASAGTFPVSWHWENPFVDIPPFRFLAERFRPASLLDIGCGLGAYVKLFAQRGVADALGVDGLPQAATALAEAQYRSHDLTQPLRLGRSFDLVLCVEVMEHLPAAKADTLLDSILRHAGQAIVFSAAEPGQPGQGHVNCQPLAHWLGRFRARGWLPEWLDSVALRSVASLSWLRRNPVVLRRAGEVAQDGTARLEAIAARDFTWYEQAPGIRATFLDESPLKAGCGYG